MEWNLIRRKPKANNMFNDCIHFWESNKAVALIIFALHLVLLSATPPLQHLPPPLNLIKIVGFDLRALFLLLSFFSKQPQKSKFHLNMNETKIRRPNALFCPSAKKNR